MANNKYTVMELEAIKKLCKSVNLIANLPTDLIADTNVATNTTYSSYRIDAEMSALENDIQTYVDTALAGLNKLSKEVIDDKALVVKENVLYLYKDPSDMNNDYMQIMLINGVAVELGSTTCDMSEYYTNTEIDDKFALKIDLDVLTTSFNNLVTSVDKKIDKDKIVTVLDDTVTDEQIASAKAVFNSISSISGVNNLTSLVPITNLNDFKGSSFMIGRGTANSTANVPNGIDEAFVIEYLPYDNGDRYGVQRLTLVQSIDNNYYTFERSLSNNVWRNWRRVCTTSVADVPTTYINTFENETYIKPSEANVCSYYVTNGRCEVKLGVKCLSTTNNFVQIISGLPKSKSPIYSNVIDLVMSNSGASGVFQLNTNGTLRIVCRYGDSSVTGDRFFYTSFSYPVAE